MFKTLVLPASLTAIDEQAFMGTDTEYVIVPDTVTWIADDAFEGNRAMMLFGNTDAVRKYANDHDLIVIQTNLQSASSDQAVSPAPFHTGIPAVHAQQKRLHTHAGVLLKPEYS